VEIVITPKKKNFNLKEIWDYRELFYFLVLRDISVRYKQTVLGILWTIIQPLFTMVVFTIFFNKIAGITSNTIPYPIFSFIGLVYWNYFSTSLSDVSNSLIVNQSIVTKVFFPRLIVPIYSAIVPAVDFFFSFSVLFVLLFIYHVQINLTGLLFVIPSLLFAMFLSIGFGSMLAIINVKYRDIRYVLPFFIQLLLFVSPVIYSTNIVSKQFQVLLYLNPMTGVIEFVRASLLHGYQVSILGLLISGLSSIILFILGTYIFLHYEKEIADIV